MDFADRFPLYPVIFCIVLYPLQAWVLLKCAPRRFKPHVLAVLNVAGLAAMCWLSGAKAVRLAAIVPYTRAALACFAFYLGFLIANYLLLRVCRRGSVHWVIGLWLPIVFLVYIKYFSNLLNPFDVLLRPLGLNHFEAFFIGISYLSFRLVLLAQEVRNEFAAMPTIWEYLSFAFFIPTLSVGPISPYTTFIHSLREPSRQATPVVRSFLRILVGLTKYLFFGSLVAQFTYAGLLRDGHSHAPIDLLIAFVAYPIYLYCNFAGYCDMAIGASGLLGIAVPENFDRPFITRNIQEFWNHWHMTLSKWIRDFVFTPLSKSIMHKFGPASANHAIAFSILVAFTLVGMWHGTGLHFFVFGVLQGVGLAFVHYYTVWLKRRFGREGFAAYRKNRIVKWCAIVLNFAYFAFSLFFFANTWDQIAGIFASLQWH
jgi:D-alanyl-lipoteichoic acid acyltransferase DltB (MBOAT superfamily)